MIACPRQARLALPLAALLPVRQIGEIGLDLANGILDHRPAVDEGKIREGPTEVPVRKGVGMLVGCDGGTLRPGEQLVSRDQALPHFVILL
jgi:hypothetical protein